MRRLIILAALVGLSACNRDQQSADDPGVDQGDPAQSIGGNDVTAIDAATNDSANMAADTELTFNADQSNEVDENSSAPTNTAAENAQ